MDSAGAATPPYHPQNNPGHLRCTDAEREVVAGMVRRAAEDGRLSLTELDERLEAVYAAKTHGDLAETVGDIEQAPAQAQSPAPAAPPVHAYPVYLAYPPHPPGVSDKTILPSFLLCFFLGVFGAHRFYVGKVGSAIGMIAATVFTLGVVGGIWMIVDLIVLATGSFRDRDGRILRRWTES